ncbi:MAG: RDD family protein [Rubrobacteraceae bacterium]
MAQAVTGPPVAEADVHVTGRRVLAIIVDSLVLVVLFWVMSLFFGTSSAEGGMASASLGTLGTLLYLILAFAYFTLLEGNRGQTLGKMLLGIKVVREDNGEVPGIGTAAIRTVLRLIDGIFAYLVGFIAIQISSKNQRLGEMASNTLVVRD